MNRIRTTRHHLRMIVDQIFSQTWSLMLGKERRMLVDGESVVDCKFGPGVTCLFNIRVDELQCLGLRKELSSRLLVFRYTLEEQVKLLEPCAIGTITACTRIPQIFYESI